MRLAAFIVAGGLVAAACGNDSDDGTDTGSPDDDAAADEEAPAEGGDGDTGANLTMWTRSATQRQSELFVEAYNSTHENQVELSIFPNNQYPQQVASAAGAGELPDIMAGDVVFVPNWIEQGLFLDITDRIDALPFADDLAPSHVEVGTLDDAKHVVPHTLDLSVLFYNKDIYEQAGLDPEQPPETMEELAEQARTIREEVGGDTWGTFWAGDDGGAHVFTFWPSIWAADGDVMNEDGTESTIASPESIEVFEIYRSLWEDEIASPDTITAAAENWTGFFAEGNIGVMPMPSTTLAINDEALGEGVVGVAPIPGPDGGESTFVGGDSIGITSQTGDEEAAWNFIEWTVSDEAQIDVVIGNNDIPARVDLAGEAEDERAVLINELVGVGVTPFSLNFNQAYNDPAGPWLQVVRNAVFEEGTTAEDALTEGQESLTATLSE